MLFDPEDNPKRSRIAQVLSAPVAPPAMLTPGQSGSYMQPRPMPTLTMPTRQVVMPQEPEYDRRGTTLRSILGLGGAALALAGSPFIGSGLAQGAEREQDEYDAQYQNRVAGYRDALQRQADYDYASDLAEAQAGYNTGLRQWEMEQTDRRAAQKARTDADEWDRRRVAGRQDDEDKRRRAEKDDDADALQAHRYRMAEIAARNARQSGKDDADSDPIAEEDAAILIGNYERELQQGTSVVDPRTQKRIRRPLTPTESRNYRQDIAKLQSRSRGLSARDAHRRRVARLIEGGEDWIPAAIEAYKSGALSQSEYDALLKGGAQ